MFLPVLSIAYVVVHFIVYSLAARHTVALKKEKGIFLYHALSYVLLVAGVATAEIHGAPPWTGAATGVAAGLHGVYSLSFLELWALTHRSYSLTILDRIERTPGGATAAELAGLQQVGARKQQLRSHDVQQLGLIRTDRSLSPAGLVAAVLLRLVLRISHGRLMN